MSATTTASLALRAALRVQGAGDFLHAVGFDQVPDLYVVEVLDTDAALEALPHLAHVVLEALERRQRPVVHRDAVADHPHLPGARNDPVPHEGAGDGADLRDLEDL